MIYVDDVGIPASVWNKRTGRYVESRWFHLISDQLDPAELHTFAVDKLGLHRSYFQEGKALGGQARDPGHDHYDLTVGKRKQAIQRGARPISAEELAEITMAKTRAYQASKRPEGEVARAHVPNPKQLYGAIYCGVCGWVLESARGRRPCADQPCVGRK
jgi:hypothetical protein